MLNCHIELVYDITPSLPAETRARIAEIVEATALQVEALAKYLAPVDTGYLRGSIQAGPESALIWIVKVGAEYGIFMEFGTTLIPAHPYFVPAIENVRPRFVGQMNNVISEVASK